MGAPEEDWLVREVEQLRGELVALLTENETLEREVAALERLVASQAERVRHLEELLARARSRPRDRGI